MSLFRIIGVFWLSISSMFSYGSKESSNSYVESNVIEHHDLLSKNKGEYIDANGSYVMFLSTQDMNFDVLFSKGVALFGKDFSYQYPTNYSYTFNANGINLFLANNSGNVGTYSYFNLTGWSLDKTYYDAHLCQYDIKFYTGNDIYRIRYVVYSNLSSLNNVGDVYGTFTCLDPYNETQSTQWNYLVGIRVVQSQLDNLYFWSLFCVGGNNSYSAGYQNGYDDGKADPGNAAYQNGYNAGYQTGYADAGATNPYMNSIFSGILEVGLLPVNVFLEMFNYELFGVNVSGLVSGLLTMTIVVIIVRFLFGGKNDK